jgi:RND family efflux transporter MFP subunit
MIHPLILLPIPMKSISLTLVIPSLALVLSSCGKHGPESSQNAAARPAVVMEVAQVAWTERPLYEPSVGTVRPHRQADVSAKLTGRVLQMLAVPGQRAKEGDLLAEIDAGELRASVERARAARDQAKRDFDRVSSLLASHAISQSEFEQAQARYRGAVASTDEAERMLANAEVRAPFTGMITRKDMDTGDLAMPGKPLFAMEDSARLRLESHVAESLAGAMKTGDMIRVTVDAAGVDIEGVVAEISPSSDAGSHTFLVKIDLPSHELLRAGQFGRAHIPRGTHRSLDVPESAVLERGQMEMAFVIERGKARMHLVRTGRRDGGRVEILSGLDAGETLLLAPGAGLRDGDPVQASAH